MFAGVEWQFTMTPPFAISIPEQVWYTGQTIKGFVDFSAGSYVESLELRLEGMIFPPFFSPLPVRTD